jgi:hypothetical protein
MGSYGSFKDLYIKKSDKKLSQRHASVRGHKQNEYFLTGKPISN